jgi:hypothetical protein
VQPDDEFYHVLEDVYEQRYGAVHESIKELLGPNVVPFVSSRPRRSKPNKSDKAKSVPAESEPAAKKRSDKMDIEPVRLLSSSVRVLAPQPRRFVPASRRRQRRLMSNALVNSVLEKCLGASATSAASAAPRKQLDSQHLQPAATLAQQNPAVYSQVSLAYQWFSPGFEFLIACCAIPQLRQEWESGFQGDHAITNVPADPPADPSTAAWRNLQCVSSFVFPSAVPLPAKSKPAPFRWSASAFGSFGQELVHKRPLPADGVRDSKRHRRVTSASSSQSKSITVFRRASDRRDDSEAAWLGANPHNPERTRARRQMYLDWRSAQTDTASISVPPVTLRSQSDRRWSVAGGGRAVVRSARGNRYWIDVARADQPVSAPVPRAAEADTVSRLVQATLNNVPSTTTEEQLTALVDSAVQSELKSITIKVCFCLSFAN